MLREKKHPSYYIVSIYFQGVDSCAISSARFLARWRPHDLVPYVATACTFPLPAQDEIDGSLGGLT
eukprot:scaffold202685_cov51-Prasinocladus_malaysianus.AAC.1